MNNNNTNDASELSNITANDEGILEIEVKESAVVNKMCYCGELAPTQQNITYENGTKKKLTLNKHCRSLKCKNCSRWIHLDCIKTPIEYPPVNADYMYIFLCSDCANLNGQDSFEYTLKRWTDVCVVALYNVWLQEMIDNHHGDIINGKRERECYFRLHDVIAFIDKNWKALCTGRERTKTWGATINSTISTRAGDNGAFFKGSTELDLELGFWSLNDYLDIPEPYKEATVPQTPTGKSKKPKPLTYSTMSRTRDFDYDVEEEKDWYWFPRNYEPLYFDYTGKQVMCPENSSKNIKIEDGKKVSNDGCYRVSRASHGVSEGNCYFEVKILQSENTETIARVGWSMRFGDVESPLGFDDFSYSYHSKSGKVFHKSFGKDFGEPYQAGDIIGCLIHLPPNTMDLPKGLVISPQAQEEIVKSLKKNEGSKITFFKNGVNQGDAYVDIPHGAYFPAVSVYSGSVSVSFGPPDTLYEPNIFPFKYALDLPPPKPLPTITPLDPSNPTDIIANNYMDINNMNTMNNYIESNNMNMMNNENNNQQITYQYNNFDPQNFTPQNFAPQNFSSVTNSSSFNPNTFLSLNSTPSPYTFLGAIDNNPHFDPTFVNNVPRDINPSSLIFNPENSLNNGNLGSDNNTFPNPNSFTEHLNPNSLSVTDNNNNNKSPSNDDPNNIFSGDIYENSDLINMDFN